MIETDGASITSKLDAEIAALQGEIATRSAELSTLKDRLSEKRVERTSLVYNIRVGDIVRHIGPGCDRKEYRVTSINPRDFQMKPWLEGTPRKQDGSFGTRSRNLYNDWEKVPTE